MPVKVTEELNASVFSKPFGSLTPFAEPSSIRGYPNPYYNESHQRLRHAVREWVETNVIPFAQQYEEEETYPHELYQKAARDGLLMPLAAGGRIPKEWCERFPIIGSISSAEWDSFHDVVLLDELSRMGGIGLQNALFGTVILSMPVIQKFGSSELREHMASHVLHGNARLCLAITEPDAGSDIRGICSEITLLEDERHLRLNGQKKWITGGMYADYFLVLVKDEEFGGMTFLVVERCEGVTTKHMKTSGSGAAGTAFVDFDDVVVPLNNIVGERGQALKHAMSNFNHERLFIGIQALRCARICLQDSIEYAQVRETFGKILADQPLIRNKLAHMSRETESATSWMESLVYQLQHLSPRDRDFLLAGPIAHFKCHAGIVLEHVVREAVQIMGGIGLTRGGRGGRVEQIWRDVKAIVVPGGSEEILLDLAVRRAIRVQQQAPKGSKL